MRANRRFINGLFYFPLMTNIADNDKIKVLIAEHKKDGFAFLILLWANLYKNDYYKKFTAREKKIFCNDFGFDLKDADNYLDTCFSEDIFDGDLFDKYEILTSKSIQEVWVDITYRRVKLKFVKEYMLIGIDIIPNNKRVELIDINNHHVALPKPKVPRKSRAKPKTIPEEQVHVDITGLPEWSTTIVRDFIKIPFEKQEEMIQTSSSPREYSDFVDINVTIDKKYSGIRKSTRQLRYFDYLEFINETEPTPAPSEIISAFKKMATLGVNANMDIYLRLGECLGMIRKPFIPKPFESPSELPVILNGHHHRDAELESKVLTFFGFNKIANPEKEIAFVQFITAMKNAGRLEEFKKQFDFYSEYKTLNGIAFRHAFDSFIGKQSEQFANAKWMSENWEIKLTDEKNKKANKNVTTKTIPPSARPFGNL